MNDFCVKILSIFEQDKSLLPKKSQITGYCRVSRFLYKLGWPGHCIYIVHDKNENILSFRTSNL